MSTYPSSHSHQTAHQLRVSQRLRSGSLTAPSLETILATFPRLPARTAVLGVGGDGLPVLFDLQDERPGALLITADRGVGKTSLLQTLMVSSIALSLPHEVQFVIIADDLSRWEWLDADPDAGRYMLDLVSPQEPAAGGWIVRLAKMASARQKGLQSGPIIVLLIDGLEFLAECGPDVQSAFEWLLRNGSAAGIWPVATLPAPRLASLQPLVDQFPTHIIGRLGSREAVRSLGLDESAGDQVLQAAFRFSVQVGGRWVEFDLPVPVVRQTWR